jgi:2-hydroxychromene-2-carboxylate isomerase
MFSGEALGLTAPLTACIDFRSANSYLAIAPTMALSKELDISVDWRPSVAKSSAYVNVQAADAGAPLSGDVKKRHAMVRARYVLMDQGRYASRQGAKIKQPNADIDPTPASMALLWVRQENPRAQTDFVRTIFEALWAQGRDIADGAVIDETFARLKLDTDGFRNYLDGAGLDDLAANQTQLETANLFDTPTFFADGDMYIGRQHLPYIRWRLNGSVGDAHF